MRLPLPDQLHISNRIASMLPHVIRMFTSSRMRLCEAPGWVQAASAYAPPPGSNAGLVGSISSFAGNVRDSLSAIGSTVGECSAPTSCFQEL